MPHIHSIETSVPAYAYTQLEIFELLAPHYPKRLHGIFKKILNGSGIKRRYFSSDAKYLINLCRTNDTTSKFKIWEHECMRHLSDQVSNLLNKADLSVDEIDGICVNSTTGFTIPGLDVMLADKFNLKSDIVRFPFFGLACTGGLMSLNRMTDYLKAYPQKCILYCCAETNSQHMEINDNLDSMLHNSLFGDGFVSMLLVGKEHPLADTSQAEILSTQSHFIPGTEKFLSYTMENSGYVGHIDSKVPYIIRDNIATPFKTLLSKNDITLGDIKYMISHVGGPRILMMIVRMLKLDLDLFRPSLSTFHNYGNQSSVSVLTTLSETIQNNSEDGFGLMMAMGPGVSFEMSYCRVTPRKQKLNGKYVTDRHIRAAV